MARRGKISTIFTDNGRNFVGAHNELKRLFKLVSNPDNILAHYLGSEKIHWNFIPPKSAHFGGLWEAGVKSFKFHFLRAVGNLKLIYEEFLTVSNQIEGILNSRPLIPLSSDANDLQALSPVYFLVCGPISAVVEPNLTEFSDNALKRWQRVTKITQYVWFKWQRDYLNHLQQKNNWYFQKDNINIGTLVIVKEDNVPLNFWLLGRIVKAKASLSIPLLFSEPKACLSPPTNKNFQNQTQMPRNKVICSSKRSEKGRRAHRSEGGQMEYFCRKGLLKNSTAVVCKQHKPFS
ncbi:hypothetical protein AVEN_203855-1 [Araneus ventricosus]|uniref:DUF5641 domain-containing protein n=1 Tax=Araneus ventricosus TaxID=182803 RepID=A0A4Y2IAF4_ARAVE|nr:hypothetical protein AVEN_203855-1 [Araneus ventricosus]